VADEDDRRDERDRAAERPGDDGTGEQTRLGERFSEAGDNPGGDETSDTNGDETVDAGEPDAADRSETGASTDTATPGQVDGDDPIRDTVELGVELLAHLESEVSLAEAIDHLETVTTDPAVTREILDTAEMRGVIDREDGVVRPLGHAYVRFSRDVVARSGEFICRRCGATIATGYFIQFDSGEHGPFGSSCIRKVVGREE